MIVAALTGNRLHLAATTLLCAGAVAATVWAAAVGHRRQRSSRLALASVSTMFLAIYTGELFGWISREHGADWRRGGSWVLWGSIAWAAISGAITWRSEERFIRHISETISNDDT